MGATCWVIKITERQSYTIYKFVQRAATAAVAMAGEMTNRNSRAVAFLHGQSADNHGLVRISLRHKSAYHRKAMVHGME